ncbi:type III secretion exporter [Gemmatirosa kalamazoonensis]|uniref:Type III secretion exporter n=1 Tax=Gemmatirosa kalamazoonensis TaxID=861299 RepID=W0RBQ3_9BACT|nr:EscU/YscU/HrcU family type III secretion system export apparatus switch protein [Gemmatirosa kalamazoonensis]AHG87740.1 type III secretion exporter [Gemmatirosa kalamazoonensis]
MADTEQEKTEAPTQRKRDDAAKDGRVPRSQELNAAVLLLTSALALNATGPGLARAMRDLMGSGLGYASVGVVDGPGIVSLIRLFGWKTLGALAAFLATMAGASLAIGALQARGTMSAKPITPDFNRLNPAQNAKRVIGTQGFVELFKALLKLLIVGWAVWHVLAPAWPAITALGQQPPRALLEIVREYGVGMLRTAGLAYLALAGADYAWQLWQHEKGLRMTKEEVKQEHKNQEGDPMVKSRMRALARQRVRQQMFKDVKKADVVLVNPVHIAVALKYDPSVAPAPYVVALGRRKVAERIKALAYEAGVPVVENVPLARALIAAVKLGQMIPTELYLAVAEVLAFVMRKRTNTAA